MDRCSCGYLYKSFLDILMHIELADEGDADQHQVEIDDPTEIMEELNA